MGLLDHWNLCGGSGEEALAFQRIPDGVDHVLKKIHVPQQQPSLHTSPPSVVLAAGSESPQSSLHKCSLKLCTAPLGRIGVCIAVVVF